MKTASIKYIVSHFPENELSNEMLIEQIGGGWNPQDIYNKTGILSRRVAGDNECSSDLGVAAANKLFATGCVSKQEIDFLIFCTQSPDYFLPASACVMQEKLGLRTSCGALDINQGCSGYVYSLALAKGLIEANVATNILLITAETYTKFINPRDRSARTIFGDGASATLLTAVDSEEQIGPFVLGTDGRGAENLIVPAGGLRMPKTQEALLESEDESGNVRSPANLYMNGPEIFIFTLKAVPAAVAELLRKSNKELADIDYFIFHQANKFMLDRLRNKLKIPESKFFINLEYGNTVSSTVPVALEKAKQQGAIQPGETVMLVGFGVGYSWGATLIKVW